MKDRVAQLAAKLVLEPIFEAGFKAASYGFRPGRSATQAMETIRKAVNSGCTHVFDADIRDYFGSIDQELLMKRVALKVSDRKVLKLLSGWLQAGTMEEGRYSETVSGTPQGGVISPLLSNIYLHFLDAVWERQCGEVGVLVRYADDLVVLCRTAKAVKEAERRVRIIFERLRLDLHPEKTRSVDLSNGKEGFDFLGCHHHLRVAKSLMLRTGKIRWYLQRWPSARSMKRVRQRVKELTGADRGGAKDVKVVIDDLNPVLRGWGNYHRTGNASQKFQSVDWYVNGRLTKLLLRRAGNNLRAGSAKSWTPKWFREQGLYRLTGTVRYAKAA